MSVNQIITYDFLNKKDPPSKIKAQLSSLRHQ